MTNPHSGGGKTARYGLVQRAEEMGAQVWTTSAEGDAASLAKNAVAEGAQVLGVVGGDGTVSASPRRPPTRAGHWSSSRRAHATTSPGTWAST
ncbi:MULTISPECIES: diacylglycerol kinase family protein [unclassified Streptomyces]|uniref:diacylglycerol kinase family protein n=1 Tax=unclassified Streptomyces TaxID=2593676 RepID=UPI0022772521|nr:MULTISPECIES: diacylglycerol kinase family protein [unclassified Streptomyces]